MPRESQPNPRILVFAGSIRSGADSAKTADFAQQQLAIAGADVTRISLADYPLPLMDEDLEAAEGVPKPARQLSKLLATHDGVLIASPEYNASIPPLLKNALDWASRVPPPGARARARPMEGLVAALCSSSPGLYGGSRGLYHLRAVLMHCGVEVVTPQCCISRADAAFDERGELRHDHDRQSLDRVVDALLEHARNRLRSGDQG